MDAIKQLELRSLLAPMLSKLTPRELACIQYYYGLANSPALNCREIAEAWQVTPQRIRQIINRGLRRLRYYAYRDGSQRYCKRLKKWIKIY